MKTITSILITLFLLASHQMAFASSNYSSVEYISNYDADTIAISHPDLHPLLGIPIKVRVNGIDSPEIRSKVPCNKETARQGKKYVAAKIMLSKRLDLKNCKKGKYFNRIICDFYIDGQNLADALIKNRLAIYYKKNSKGKLEQYIIKDKIKIKFKKKEFNWCRY